MTTRMSLLYNINDNETRKDKDTNMATETKKTDREHSVEERLKALYQLQTYLSEIDRIRTQRGELPNEVKDCEDEIARYELRIAKHTEEINMLSDEIQRLRGVIEDSKMKVARYDEQINNVRNNREYTFLEKEREYQTLEIELSEKKIRDAQARIDAEKEAMAHDNEELEDHRHILETKRAELEEIVSETRVQEDDLLKQAKSLEPMIDDYTLAAFKRIRKNARNGLGIVTVQRDACGGCFNRIPAQRQLEIKMHKKVIVCEYCGRIMIDAQLAGIEEPKAQEQPSPRKSRAKKSAAK